MKHLKLKKIIKFLCFILLFIPLKVFSDAKIKVDSSNFNAGSIKEGQMKLVRHTFTIKNIGKDTLIIKRVKPGWGCTVVDYDSIIPPGQAGKITPQVNISKLNNGTFSKSVTIISNASNNNNLKLTLRGKILTHLYSSKRFIRVIPDANGNIKTSIDLNTEKSNLEITSIYFKEKRSDNKNSPTWQPTPNLYPKFSITKTDTTDIDGYYTYKIDLFLNISPSKTISGDFFFNTNHPKKKVVQIRGIIVPPTKE